MATAKTISQRIALEGAEDIRRLLEQIGHVGEKAFAQISAAVSPATKNLEGLSKAVANVQVQIEKVADAGRNFGSSLQNLGGAANNFGSSLATVATRIGAITAAAGAAAAGVAAFAISAIKAADDIGETAAALGLSTKSYQELQFAAAQAGVSQEQFATGMARLSRNIEDAAAKEAKALVDFADKVRKPLQEPGVHVVDMSRDFTREFQVINEASVRLQQQLKALGEDRPLFRIRQELKALADGGVEARKKFEELTGASLGSNKGLEQLRTAADNGGNALARLGIRTRDLSGNVRPIEDILGDVAERFKNLPEGALRTATALDLFGRSGAKLGAFLSQGRAGIRETIKELERLGILLSKEEVDAADKAANALDLLGLAAQNLKNKLGIVFAEPIREGASALTRILTQNQAALQNFARSIEHSVTPIIRDLIRLISGQEAQIENRWIIEARDRVVEFGSAVKGAVFNIIIPAFRALLGMLDTVAQGINKVFGTTLTGGQIGIAIVVAQLIGAFGVLASAVLVAAAAVKAISAGLALLFATGSLVVKILIAIGTALVALVGWPALIVAGLAAAVAAIIVFWEDIKRGAAAVWQAIKTGAEAAWNFVKDTFSKTFSGAWQWIVDTFDSAVATIKQKAEELLEFLKKKFAQSPAQGGAIPQGVPLLGQQTGRGFDNPAIPQSPNIEDRRGEAAAQQTGQQFREAAEAVRVAAEEVLTAIRAFANETAAAIALSFQTLSDGASLTMQAIIATMTGGADLIGTIVLGAFQQVSSAARAMLTSLSAALQAMMASLQAAISAVGAQINGIVAGVLANLQAAVAQAEALAAAAQAAAAAAASAGSGGSPANPPTGPGLAGGGMVWGPGTETSDSITARLSRGEFVQRAAAVRYYGADFMAALNALRIPRDAFRGFNMGGLVDGLSRSMDALAVPRFAMGGLADLAPAGRNLGTLNLALPSGRTVSVMADSEVAEALFREVKRSGMNAAVKKPF